MVGEPDVNTRYAAVDPTGDATASLALSLPLRSSRSRFPVGADPCRTAMWFRLSPGPALHADDVGEVLMLEDHLLLEGERRAPSRLLRALIHRVSDRDVDVRQTHRVEVHPLVS